MWLSLLVWHLFTGPTWTAESSSNSCRIFFQTCVKIRLLETQLSRKKNYPKVNQMNRLKSLVLNKLKLIYSEFPREQMQDNFKQQIIAF